MRILIVDDEPLARTALADILEARADIDGFACASDAVEAEERLTRESYDVMQLDISMPERTGLELLDRLRRSARPLPSVIFVTAHAQHALAAFEKHAIDYVLKPFTRALAARNKQHNTGEFTRAAPPADQCCRFERPLEPVIRASPSTSTECLLAKAKSSWKAYASESRVLPLASRSMGRRCSKNVVRFGDSIAAIRAGLQGSDGESVAQRMRRGPSASRSRWQGESLHSRAECRLYIFWQERFSSQPVLLGLDLW